MLLGLGVTLPLGARLAWAQSQEEMAILHTYYDPEDLVVVTTTRTEKPISQVAEDVTVVTAEEIQRMNAHTLADVLVTVPGVEVDMRGGPGSTTVAQIQSAEPRHVLLLMDGVALNNLSDNSAEIGSIPVQNIQRIEILKGPGSSAWGSSLGGVINVITKGGKPGTKPTALVSASYGEGDTSDLRAELSGGTESLGYYLYAGGLHSEDLTPRNSMASGQAYTKLNWQPTRATGVLFTLGYNDADRNNGRDLMRDLAFGDDSEVVISTLGVHHAVNDKVGAEASLKIRHADLASAIDQFSTGASLQHGWDDEDNYGANAKVTWKSGPHNMVLGTDYEDQRMHSNFLNRGRVSRTQWAVYANDTWSLGAWSLTPGLRYDHFDTTGDFVSPSLGLTRQLGKKTIFRAYAARGYNLPSFSAMYGGNVFFLPNPHLDVEKVISVQAGLETEAVPNLWLKLSLFHHKVTDLIDTEIVSGGSFLKSVNNREKRFQGLEVDFRTRRVFHTALYGGVTLVDVEYTDTDERAKDSPHCSWNLGLDYTGPQGLDLTIQGRYIGWNAYRYYDGEYDNFLWDLTAQKRLGRVGKVTPQAFFTVHNLFDGAQYVYDVFQNPRRWVEAGVRFTF